MNIHVFDYNTLREIGDILDNAGVCYEARSVHMRPLTALVGKLSRRTRPDHYWIIDFDPRPTVPPCDLEDDPRDEIDLSDINDDDIRERPRAVADTIVDRLTTLQQRR